MRRSVLLLSVAVLVAAAVGTGLARGSDSRSAPTSTTTTSTTIPLAVWEHEAEIVLPPAVIVPTSVSYDGGAVVVEYDLFATSAGIEPALRPTKWTLLAGGTEIEAESEPTIQRVTFDVGFQFDPTAITGLRLDEYVMLSPIQTWFLPSPDDFSTHEIAPGVTAALDIVQPQSTGAIVRVQLGASYIGATNDLAAEGVGPGWVTASSNFGGGGQWTLSFDGDELPDPLPIVVRGIMWIPVDASAVSTLEGVPID